MSGLQASPLSFTKIGTVIDPLRLGIRRMKNKEENKIEKRE
jgi:hypothetical protein